MRRAATWIGAVAALSFTAACGPKEADLQAWEARDDGPQRLVAVVRDEGIGAELRRSAAEHLIRLERRKRHVGIDLLVEALGALSPSARAPVIAALVPKLCEEIALPREKSRDPSLVAKDTAVALVAHGLVDDARLLATLRAALDRWVSTSTEARLSDTTQRYSMQATVRVLGAKSANGLLGKVESARAAAELAAVVAEVADAAGRAQASVDLAAHLSAIGGAAWRAHAQTQLDELLRQQPHMSDSPDVRAKYLQQMERADALTLITAIGHVGGAVGLSAMRAVACSAQVSNDERIDAFDALTAHASELSIDDVDAVVAVAADTATPDRVQRAAFALIAALPDRARIRSRIEALLLRGGVTRMRAALVLLGDVPAAELDAFLDRAMDPKLPSACIDEVQAWGDALLERLGAHDLQARTNDKRPVVRIVAILARTGDVAWWQRWANDPTPLPACEGDAEWHCATSADAPLWANERDRVKQTVGDVITDCFLPAVEAPAK